MAFYVYSWRDVRDADGTAVVTGTAGATRVESTDKIFYVDKATDPIAIDLIVPLKTAFPSKAHTDATWATTTAVEASTSTLLANLALLTTTVPAFRNGKQFLQFGSGKGATPTDALAAIVWRNLV